MCVSYVSFDGDACVSVVSTASPSTMVHNTVYLKQYKITQLKKVLFTTIQ